MLTSERNRRRRGIERKTMGREIRRVSLDWEHPKEEKYDIFTRQTVSSYQPMYDRDAETAWAEWLQEFDEFKRDELARIVREYPDDGYSLDTPYRSFCEWNGRPPNPKYYRPRWPEDADMGFAVYETVSEGTPVTPTFATKKELIDYLATNGTYWDKGEPWPREAAERFVEMEWAPSLMLKIGENGGQMIRPNDPAMYETAAPAAQPGEGAEGNS